MRMMDKYNQIVCKPDFSAPLCVDVKCVSLKAGQWKGKALVGGKLVPVSMVKPGVWVMPS